MAKLGVDECDVTGYRWRQRDGGIEMEYAAKVIVRYDGRIHVVFDDGFVPDEIAEDCGELAWVRLSTCDRYEDSIEITLNYKP
jgi:hypothetical protein